jgi:hypothetical protein
MKLFSYLGVMAVHAGMIDFKDLRPALLRLLPPFRAQIAQLPAFRASLQKDIRAIVKKYGPELGPIYDGKTNEWNLVQPSLAGSNSEASLSIANFLSLDAASPTSVPSNSNKPTASDRSKATAPAAASSASQSNQEGNVATKLME